MPAFHRFLLCAAMAWPAMVAGAPAFITQPSLLPNPNPAVPLAAVLRFSASGPVTTEVRISESLEGAGPRQWHWTYAPSESPEGGLAVIGFRPGGQATVDVTIRDKTGSTTSQQVLKFAARPTPPPGLAWPKVSADIADPALVEPGISIISVRRRAPGRQAWQSPAQQRFARRWGLLLGLDERGDTVWYYKSEERIAGVQALPDGRLLMTLQDQRVRIIDMLGNVQAEFIAELNPDGKAPPGTTVVKGVQTMHHEPYMTRHGTMISMSANARAIPDYFTSVTDPKAPRKTQMVMGDSLIEYGPDGKIIWRWDSFDHLDPKVIHYHLQQPYWQVRGFPGHLDWTHGNGITFNEAGDTLIISYKHLDALVGISRRTGSIKWILGDPRRWTGPLAAKVLKPRGRFQRYPFSPHHPHVSPDGTIAYYDNGMFQSWPFDGREVVPQHLNYSRGVRVKVDEKAMTFEEVWTSEAASGPDSCYHWAMGEAVQLPKTGNMMLVRAFCPPADPALSEFDEGDLSRRFVDDVSYAGWVDQYSAGQPAKRVSRLRISDPNEILQWQLYGGVHVPSLRWGQATAPEPQ